MSDEICSPFYSRFIPGLDFRNFSMKRLTGILFLNFALLLVGGCGPDPRHLWEGIRPITTHSKYSEEGLEKRFLNYNAYWMTYDAEIRHSFSYREVYVTFPIGFSELEKLKELRKRAKPFAVKKCHGQNYYLDNFVSSKEIRIFIGANIVCSKERPAEDRRKQEK